MNLKVLGIFILLVALCVFMAISVPDFFLTGNNFENLLRRTAMYSILGIGVAFVIMSSGIDLSIGSIVVLSACCLAIFLTVIYEPFDVGRVVEVKAEDRTIEISSHTDEFAEGDLIRFFGSRRARNAIVTVSQIKIDESTGHAVLTVDKPLSRDDTTGKVAKLIRVVAFEPGDPEGGVLASITLEGSFANIEARDQVTLVHPKSGLKQMTILSATVTGNETVLTLKSDLGSNFSNEWLAIPVQRKQRMPVLLALTLVLGIGLLLGLIHGLLITKMALQPFVVTLCGLLVYRSIARWLVGDQTVGLGNEYDDTLGTLATGKLSFGGGPDAFGIPIPFIIMVVIAIMAAVVLNKTIWGRYLLALGRNEDAARYSGIKTTRITIAAYMLCAGLAAMGGMLFALKSNSVPPSSFGNFYELYAIAAAVLGGCSLRGGEGSILGVVIGAAVMQVLFNLVLLLKISDTLEGAILGAVILLGVVADEALRRFLARRRAALTAAI